VKAFANDFSRLGHGHFLILGFDQGHEDFHATRFREWFVRFTLRHDILLWESGPGGPALVRRLHSFIVITCGQNPWQIPIFFWYNQQSTAGARKGPPAAFLGFWTALLS
jgi:hypothetical protein